MKSVGYYLSRVLPPNGRRRLLERSATRRVRDTRISLPSDMAHVRSVLMILPEDTLEALYQVENIVALHEHYEQASLTFLCLHSVADYLRSIVPDANFVEYPPEEDPLHFQTLTTLKAYFSEERFDMCFLLERSPSLALMDIVGRCGARVRIAYAGTADYPFVNHQVRPSACDYAAEFNSGMARTIGAHMKHPPRLIVAKEASQGVAHLLRDMGLSDQAKLLVADASSLAARFGAEWTAMLVFELAKETGMVVAVPSERSTDEALFRRLAGDGAKAVPPLTVPRTAALLSRAECLVTVPSPLLRLANLLDRPVVSVQNASDQARYVKPGKRTSAVTCEGSADLHTAAEVVSSVRAQCGT